MKIVAKSLARYAVAFVVASMEEAINLANDIAPEHLELSVDRPFDYLEKFRHAGALFLGRYTPPAVADYVAGPNHVLPTAGTTPVLSAPPGHHHVSGRTNRCYHHQQRYAVQDHGVL